MVVSYDEERIKIGLNAILLFRRIQEMTLSCEEYRHLQQLLILKKRLSENQLDPEEREEIERLVQELERELKM
jgi:hypothetical protein